MLHVIKSLDTQYFQQNSKEKIVGNLFCSVNNGNTQKVMNSAESNDWEFRRVLLRICPSLLPEKTYKRLPLPQTITHWLTKIWHFQTNSQ